MTKGCVSLRDGESLADYAFRVTAALASAEADFLTAQDTIQTLVGQIARLTAERDEARAHARNHHLEACESCAVIESDRDAALALLRRANRYLEEWSVDNSDAPDRGQDVEDHAALLAEIDALLKGTD